MGEVGVCGAETEGTERHESPKVRPAFCSWWEFMWAFCGHFLALTSIQDKIDHPASSRIGKFIGQNAPRGKYTCPQAESNARAPTPARDSRHIINATHARFGKTPMYSTFTPTEGVPAYSTRTAAPLRCFVSRANGSRNTKTLVGKQASALLGRWVRLFRYNPCSAICPFTLLGFLRSFSRQWWSLHSSICMGILYKNTIIQILGCHGYTYQ